MLSRTLLRPLSFTRPQSRPVCTCVVCKPSPTKAKFVKRQRHVPHWTERDARPRPFLGKIIHSLGILYTKPCTKFVVHSSSIFEDIDATMVDMTLKDL